MWRGFRSCCENRRSSSLAQTPLIPCSTRPTQQQQRRGRLPPLSPSQLRAARFDGSSPLDEQQLPPPAPRGASRLLKRPNAAATDACDCDRTQLPPPSPLLSAPSNLFSNPYDAPIFALALPAVLALAADPLLQVVDTIFVGQVGGSDALAALGVNSAIFTFAFVVFNFLATATTPLVASALATGDKARAGTVTVQALLLACILGGGLAAGLTLFADPALELMGADRVSNPAMFDLAKQFLLIRALASPAALLTTVGQGAFRGLQDMRIPLSITLVTNAINLGLDILLICGLGWGVKGAAAATTTAEWAAAAAYLSLLWRRREDLGGLDARSAVSTTSLSAAVADLTPFFSAGGSVLMRTALLLGTKTLASATAAKLGTVPIAAHQIVMQIWLLSSMIVDSLAVAGQSLVAVETGRGNAVGARVVSDRLLQLGVAGGFVLAGAFWAAEPVLPSIFSADAGIESAVRDILPLAVAMLPVNAAVYGFDGVFVGARDFKWMAGAMVVAAATGVTLLECVEPLDLGLKGVWGALAALMVSRLVTLTWRYQSPDGPIPPLTKEQRRQQQQRLLDSSSELNNSVE